MRAIKLEQSPSPEINTLARAFDTMPREMVMATLRWIGVPEAGLRMVEGTFEKTTSRVVVEE